MTEVEDVDFEAMLDEMDAETPFLPPQTVYTKSLRAPMEPLQSCPCGCGFTQPDIIQSEVERLRKGTWMERVGPQRSPLPKKYRNCPSKRFRRLASQHEGRARRMGVPWDVVNLELVYIHHGGICGICREAVDRKSVTFDHVVALVNGGAHVWENLQLAHASCNSRKGPKLGQTWPETATA